MMIELLARENLETRADCAAFGIVRAVDQTGNTRLYDGAGAHAARLNRHVKSRASQTVVPGSARPFAQNYNFCVRRRVAIANCPISRARDDLAVCDKHCTNRDFARFRGSASFFESQVHKFDVRTHGQAEHSMVGRMRSIQFAR